MAGNFSAESLVATVADRILQTGTTPPLAHVLLDNPWLSQLLFLPIIFVQMMAVVAAFRPRLHQAWGAAIIAFHIGTWLLMEILFVQHVALLALFLLASPFAPPGDRRMRRICSSVDQVSPGKRARRFSSAT